MMVGLDYFINRSRLGRGIRAVAQDANTAALMGINKDRIILLVFIIGGAMAGVAGLLYNVRIGTLTYSVGFLLGTQGVHRRGARRYRQPARRAARRPAAGSGRELRVRPVRWRVEGPRRRSSS